MIPRGKGKEELPLSKTFKEGSHGWYKKVLVKLVVVTAMTFAACLSVRREKVVVSQSERRLQLPEKGIGGQLFQWFVVLFLVAMSGLFSGLTLGLLGLDKTGLEIVIGGGSEAERRWAQRVIPVREDGNRLLCTLLLGNVIVNSGLSIFLSGLFDSLVGLFASTALIVVFGEILPQATCSRHALQIGATTVPIVKVFLFLLAPVAYPLARGLDCLLDEDVGTIHTRTEMLQYMRLHVQRGELDQESGLLMEGALKMKHKTCADVMTPLEDVYMLPDTTRLNFKTVRDIFEHGFSRVPVFSGEKQNIVGLLFVKDLIFVDPEDETPLSSLLSIFHRGLHTVNHDNTLDVVLRIFKCGHGHLALVKQTPDQEIKLTTTNTSIHALYTYHGDEKSTDAQEALVTTQSAPAFNKGNDNGPIVGIVTLEDIVEEIIGDEIIDETDVFVDVDKHIKVEGRTDFDFTRLRRLDAQYVDERLSPEEVQAVTAHLLTNVRQLEHGINGQEEYRRRLSKEEMTALVRNSTVVDRKRIGKIHSDKVSARDIVYSRNEPTEFAVLVLGGKLTVRAGKDGFRAEAGPWTVLAADALVSKAQEYRPDFSAHVATDTVRLVYIRRSDYAQAFTLSERANRLASQASERFLNPSASAAAVVGNNNTANFAHSDDESVFTRSKPRRATSSIVRGTGAASTLNPSQRRAEMQERRKKLVAQAEPGKRASLKATVQSILRDNPPTPRSQHSDSGAPQPMEALHTPKEQSSHPDTNKFSQSTSPTSRNNTNLDNDNDAATGS